MVQGSYKAEAPGSLMIMGEYAVLHGYPAIVAAINKKIRVTITSHTHRLIYIKSALGDLIVPLDQIKVEKPFEYVLAALTFSPPISGCEIEIEAEFDSTKGLGSSAAVTVALLGALNQWHQRELNLPQLFQDALRVIHNVQGKGSGADIAASIFGGIIEYSSNPFHVKPLAKSMPASVIYSGHKTTTTQALQMMQRRLEENPDFYQKIFKAIGDLVPIAAEKLRRGDWPALGQIMNQAQDYLMKLQVSTPAINKIIDQLKNQNTIYGAKISGAGFGDCVIALGHLSSPIPTEAGIQTLGISLAPDGVTYVH